MLRVMRDLIEQLQVGTDLSALQVEDAVRELTDPDAEETPKADFLRALRGKGETAGEIAAFAQALLDRAIDPELDVAALGRPVVDVCGTGGDKMELFNVSTATMFVVSGAGAVVVKHGNRGITSKCGGADVLEALGVRIDLAPEAFAPCVRETGLGFLFAPAWHHGFRAIGPVRKALAAEGVPTIFNLLGPLLNPTRPPFQLIGIFSATLLPKYAEALRLLGRRRAWVVNGEASGGRSLDEISLMGLTRVSEVTADSASEFTIDPAQLGLGLIDSTVLRGGDRAMNAEIITGILQGRIVDGRRDVVLLNAAAALTVTGSARSLQEGLSLAATAVSSGAALSRLEALRDFTNR